MKIGILGIQGGFTRHAEAVQSLGYQPVIVKTKTELDQIDKLIMPGGESTAMRLLLKKHGLWHPLQEFVQEKSVFGTCAGAILLAHTIDSNEESLNAIDIDIKRNSYGRQIDSFHTDLEVNLNGIKHLIPSMFIRAPEITRVGKDVDVLATYPDKPVLVQQKNVLIATFHPELTADTTICNYFINLN